VSFREAALRNIDHTNGGRSRSRNGFAMGPEVVHVQLDRFPDQGVDFVDRLSRGYAAG
jgi:hypothetical protein